MDSGREDCCGTYVSYQEAIERITSLYIMDSKSAMKGQYYYFMKER